MIRPGWSIEEIAAAPTAGAADLRRRSCRGGLRPAGSLLKHAQPARAFESAQVYLGVAPHGDVIQHETAAQCNLPAGPLEVRRSKVARLLVQLNAQLRPALRVRKFNVDEPELLNPPLQGRGGSFRAEGDLHRVGRIRKPLHQLVHVTSSDLAPAARTSLRRGAGGLRRAATTLLPPARAAA